MGDSDDDYDRRRRDKFAKERGGGDYQSDRKREYQDHNRGGYNK